MMGGSKRLLLAAACILVAVVLYWAKEPTPRPAAPSELSTRGEARSASSPSQASAVPEAPTQQSSGGGSVPVAAASTPQPLPGTQAPPIVDPDGPPPSFEPADRLPADPAQDLDEVQGMVRNFRDAIGDNPVGTNAEITGALLGDNSKQLRLTVPVGSRVNEQGELVDRWGTPYFFHQVSAKEMEIRSAGPDRRMWTSDDRQAR